MGDILNVVLNDNVTAKMILDTGASFVVITEHLSKKLKGLSSRNKRKITIQTAGGQIKAKPFVIEKVAIGNAVKKNVYAVVTPDNFSFQGFDGLLGLSFLEDFNVTIDYKNNKIRLKKH